MPIQDADEITRVVWVKAQAAQRLSDAAMEMRVAADKLILAAEDEAVARASAALTDARRRAAGAISSLFVPCDSFRSERIVEYGQQWSPAKRRRV